MIKTRLIDTHGNTLAVFRMEHLPRKGEQLDFRNFESQGTGQLHARLTGHLWHVDEITHKYHSWPPIHTKYEVYIYVSLA